ncbi:MAG: DUF885 family protein [Planctomycetota bacterium]
MAISSRTFAQTDPALKALAYKIGELRILQLRREAEKKLGDKFDLRAFHDALLSGGAMPIDVLETRMWKWIEGEHRASP